MIDKHVTTNGQEKYGDSVVQIMEEQGTQDVALGNGHKLRPKAIISYAIFYHNL